MSIIRRNLLSKYNVPYDAELEWIGVCKGASINTGIYPSTNYKYYWKYLWYGYTANTYIFTNSSSNGDWFIFGGVESSGKAQIHIKDVSYVNGSVLAFNTIYTGSLEKVDSNLVVTLNNTTYSQLAYENFTSSSVLYIKNTTSIPTPIYYFKVKDNNNNVILNAKPVRIGQVGYMYDTISRQLLPNTGTLILGPDKSETPIYDKKVRYLRNTSSAAGASRFETDYKPNTKTEVILVGNISGLTKQTRFINTQTNPLRLDIYINGSSYYAYNFNTTDNNKSTAVKAITGNTVMDINGVSKTFTIYVAGAQKVNLSNITMPSSYAETNEYLKIFGGASGHIPFVGDIIACFIYDNGQLVRYYYPVRNEGVGYLHELFSNTL